MTSRLDQIRRFWNESRQSDEGDVAAQARYLLKLVDELAGALESYLGEYDMPVPDYTLRYNYRRQLQIILSKLNEPADG